MEKWINKVAIVTGASVGIGKDITIKLVNHGLTVVGCGRNLDNLLKVKHEIPKDSKGEFIPFQCDVSKEQDVLKMFDYVKTNLKELSIMINNAGFSFDVRTIADLFLDNLVFQGSILKGKTENWKSMYETNVLGLCMCTREAYSLMKENENSIDKVHTVPGHIININSIIGHVVSPATFGHFYSSTKFAVKAISEAIRQELREVKSNIRITQISPGMVETEFALRAGGPARVEQMKKVISQPLEASDISDAVIFTLSAESRSSVHEMMIRPTMQIV